MCVLQVVLSVSLYHTPSTPSTITRGRGELVAFDCRVQTVDLLSSGEINPEALLAQLTQVGFGDFNVGIEFRNSDFSAAITQSPLAVTLGKEEWLRIIRSLSPCIYHFRSSGHKITYYNFCYQNFRSAINLCDYYVQFKTSLLFTRKVRQNTVHILLG